MKLRHEGTYVFSDGTFPSLSEGCVIRESKRSSNGAAPEQRGGTTRLNIDRVGKEHRQQTQI